MDDASGANAVRRTLSGMVAIPPLPDGNRWLGAAPQLLLRHELLADGWTEREIRWRVRSRRWVQLRYGVYVEASVLDALESDPVATHALYVRAALLRLLGRVVASHESAALLHGFALLAPPTGVSTTRDSARRHPQQYRDLTVHAAALPASHISGATPYGAALTSGPRTVVDVARIRSRRQAVVLADSALRSGRVTPATLAAVLEAAEGWPGVESAREVVDFADGRAESALESVSRVSIDEIGLPAPDLQVTLGDASGAAGRVDFLWREHRTIGEADGLGKYVDRADKIAEMRRQERLEAMGFEVVRWGFADVAPSRLPELRRRIEDAFARAHRGRRD